MLSLIIHKPFQAGCNISALDSQNARVGSNYFVQLFLNFGFSKILGADKVVGRDHQVHPVDANFLNLMQQGKAYTPVNHRVISVRGSRKGLFVGFGFALSDSKVRRLGKRHQARVGGGHEVGWFNNWAHKSLFSGWEGWSESAEGIGKKDLITQC